MFNAQTNDFNFFFEKKTSLYFKPLKIFTSNKLCFLIKKSLELRIGNSWIFIITCVLFLFVYYIVKNYVYCIFDNKYLVDSIES